MSQYSFIQPNFGNPSLLFKTEDLLKAVLGGTLLYNGYYRTFDLKGNETVLDFGCGGGTGSRILAKLLNNGYLICLDTSTYWINKARKRLRNYTNVKCLYGDIDTVQVPDSSIDVITVIHVIHDITPAGRQRTVNSLSNKLKPGGRFFIKEPIKESHGMPVAEIRELFARAGMREAESQNIKTEYIARYIKTA